MPSKYSDEFRAARVKQYRKGRVQMKDLADRYGVAAPCMQQWVRAAGGGYFVSDKDWAAFCALIDWDHMVAEETDQDISDITGLTRHCVTWLRNDLGVRTAPRLRWAEDVTETPRSSLSPLINNWARA